MKRTIAVLMGVMLLAMGAAAADTAAPLASWHDGAIDMTPVAEHISELDEAHVLLVQDVIGWANANEEILMMLDDVTYDMINSSSLAGTDLEDYTYVVIAGGQNSTFNSNVIAAMDHLEAYVADGGWLQMHFGTNAHDPHLTLFDGTSYDQNTPYENENFMGPDGEDHPILDGMVEPYTGFNANHGSITNYPDDALVLIVDSGGLATTIEYTYGQGNIVASTCPLEHAYNGDYGMGQSLYNMMVYMADAPPAGPVQFNLVPQVTVIPPSGGELLYGVELISVYPGTVPGLTFWTMITIPNGQQFGPMTSVPFTHTPNMNVLITNIAQDIPQLAPSGTYLFEGHIGFAPNPYLSDDFDFEKLGTTPASGGVLPNAWPVGMSPQEGTIVRMQ